MKLPSAQPILSFISLSFILCLLQLIQSPRYFKCLTLFFNSSFRIEPKYNYSVSKRQKIGPVQIVRKVNRNLGYTWVKKKQIFVRFILEPRNIHPGDSSLLMGIMQPAYFIPGRQGVLWCCYTRIVGKDTWQVSVFLRWVNIIEVAFSRNNTGHYNSFACSCNWGGSC